MGWAVLCPNCKQENSEFDPFCSQCGGALETAQPPELLSQQLAHFEVKDKLGQGGMGSVYRAWDKQLERHVALKLIRGRAGRLETQRLLTEARTASVLLHPNIVTVFGLFEDQEQIFYAMELVEGETLENTLKRGPLPVETVQTLALDMAKGLAYAHSHGVVHRDIKPSNVMVTDDGRAKILDFGLARVSTGQILGPDSLLATRDGEIKGTLPYMSPEQVQGQTANEKSDMFSFGSVLYEMLTGQRPFPGKSALKLKVEISKCQPKSLAAHLGEDHDFFRIIERCMEAEPGQRFDSMNDVAAAIHAISTPHPKTSRWPIWVAAMLLLGALLTPILASRFGWFGLYDRQKVIQKIAVLPFQNIGADPSNQIFCDGFSTAISNQLAGLNRSVPGSWVVPATELRRLAVVNGPSLYNQFGVTHVLSGSIRQFGRTREVTLDLIDARSLSLIRSWHTTLDDSQLFRAQTDILEGTLALLNWPVEKDQIAEALKGETEVPQAFRDYVLALGYLYRYDQEGNLERAIAYFEKALESDPNFVLAWVGISQVHLVQFRNNDQDESLELAMQAANRALKARDDLGSVYLCLGQIEMERGNYETAVQHFQNTLRRDNKNARAEYALAQALDMLGQEDPAQQAFDRAAQLEPGNWNGQTARARFFFNHGKLDKAEAVFRHLIEIAPENAFGYSNLGAVLFHLEHLDEAKTTLQKAIELNPNEWSPLSNLGTLLYFQGDYEKAAEAFERAKSLRPGHYLLWGNWGDALRQLGKVAESQEAYANAVSLLESKLEVRKGDPDLLCDLALYHAKMGHHEPATAILNDLAAEDLEPDYRKVIIAQVQELTGQRPQAVSTLAKAIEQGYSILEIEKDPEFKQLVQDPAFREILKK
ncbi:MAG: protein kinase [Acidobacteria bacterium]|nr:protein kinase [Acidobacteriota bacterium]